MQMSKDIATIISGVLKSLSIVPRISSVDKQFIHQCLSDAAALGCPVDHSTTEVISFQPWNISGATIASTAYGHLECSLTKRHIALCSSLAHYIEDVYKDDPALINGFNDNFIMRRPHRTAVLQAFDSCLRETRKHFDAIQTNLIVSSSLNFVTAISIENTLEAAQTSSYTQKFPDFLRGLSGIPCPFAIFIFPKTLPLHCYLQAIPDICDYINYMNDLLSFYKEEAAGEDHNYVSIIAKCRKISKLKVLEELAHSVTSSHSTVANILSGSPQALQAWKSFTEGYVNYHTSFARYRLEEVLDLQSVSSAKL